MTRVVIADDHPFVRRGLRETLDDTGEARVVGEAADGAAALHVLRDLGDGVDVLVLDLSMPGIGGLEVLSRLAAERSGLPVLVLSMHAARELGLQALRAGAWGYLSKHAPPEHFVEAVRRLADGGRYVGRELAETLAELSVAGASDASQALSVRELQVVRSLALGHTREETACALRVSPATVSTYKRRARRKLRLATDGDLIRHAIRSGLVE